MPDPIAWFFNHIVPYLAVSIIGGAWLTFRKVDKIETELQKLTSDYHHLALIIDDKWKHLDEKVKEDINDVRAKLAYIQNHNVTRDELNQYLQQLNITVSRLSETINKLL